MRVVVFSASPRLQSNSEILADCVLAGARDAGATVEKIRLHGRSIAPCTACDACQASPATPCVIRDDMGPLLDLLRAADVVVFASPVYFFSVAAQMKLFLDRTYALGGGGRWDALSGKRAVVTLTYGDSDPKSSGVKNAIGTFEDACAFLGMELVRVVHASCSRPGEIRSNPAALDEAAAAGRAAVLAAGGS